MKHKQLLKEEQVLKLAAAWEEDKVGHHRNEDGTIPGWHDWAKYHPQSENDVVVCHGRDEWECKLYSEEEASNKPLRFLSVVSWNILSQTWLLQGWREGKYDHTAEEETDWRFRFQILFDWIDKMSPDILALQEVDYDKFSTHLEPELKQRGYKGIIQMPKKKAKCQPCGNASFWNSKKYQLVEHKSFSRTQCIILDYNNVSNEGQNLPKLCIINIHLESCQEEVGADRRARQLNSALLFAATKAKDSAIIACGDYNTGGDSSLFCTLRDYLWHGHDLSSVYEHRGTSNTLPVNHGTFMVPGHHYLIDHMLYTHKTLLLQFVFNALSPQEKFEHVIKKGKDCGFPNAFCPSDHIPIGAMFQILSDNHVGKPLSESNENCRSTAQVNSLCRNRQKELSEEWKALLSTKPESIRGKPTPDQIVERRAYAQAVKALKNSLQGNPSELEYLNKLIKNS